MKVAVVGASGFVGSAIVASLEQAGHHAVAITAPRLTHADPSVDSILLRAEQMGAAWAETVADRVSSCDAIINAAGIATAAAASSAALLGANALLPAVILHGAREVGSARYIHVSSAAVQGRRRVLDETMTLEPFSPYSNSKAAGEQALMGLGDDRTVIYRPTSVHGVSRRITHQLMRLASSPYAVVAGGGAEPTPQVLACNVGAAAVHLATADVIAPRVVLHPWEGLTTAALLRVLGGREPRSVHSSIARGAVAAGYTAATWLRRGDGYVRRVELLLFGQHQAPGWLAEQEWVPPFGLGGWSDLRRDVLLSQGSRS